MHLIQQYENYRKHLEIIKMVGLHKEVAERQERERQRQRAAHLNVLTLLWLKIIVNNVDDAIVVLQYH